MNDDKTQFGAGLDALMDRHRYRATKLHDPVAVQGPYPFRPPIPLSTKVVTAIAVIVFILLLLR